MDIKELKELCLKVKPKNLTFLDNHRPQKILCLVCDKCNKSWRSSYIDRTTIDDILCPLCKKSSHIRPQNKYEMATTGGDRVEPRDVLLHAMNINMQDVIVVGKDKAGYNYLISSSGKIEKDIFTLEKAKYDLLQIVAKIDNNNA